MYKIVFSNTPTVKNAEMTQLITDPAVLRKADGLVSEDSCLAYLDEANAELLTGGGQIRLRFDKAGGRLVATTEYTADKKLTAKQLQALKDDTRGQWSDGVGSSCFDEFDRREGVHIELVSMENYGRETIEQTKLAAPTAKPKRGANVATLAAKGDLEKIRQVIAAGADLNLPDREGFTPLGLAITYAHVEAALLLIEAGAQVNLRDKREHTPLFSCSVSNRIADGPATRIAEELIRRGAEVNAASPDNPSTPLDLALNRGKVKLARLLLAHGGRVAPLDPYIYPPLWRIADSELSDEDSVAWAKDLIDLGMSAEVRWAHAPKGMTVLSIAADAGKPKFQDYLRKLGAT